MSYQVIVAAFLKDVNKIVYKHTCINKNAHCNEILKNG